MSLDDYIILNPIGSGAYSNVFKVRCKSTNSLFAMKEIKFDRLSAKEKEYAKTEVKILTQIQHPNVIKLEKSFSCRNNFYLIMELASCDLQHKIDDFQVKKQIFPINLIWNYTYQIVSGLQALHEKNILHRDIKASNIFLMESGVVKIGDLNIGKEAIDEIFCTKIGTPVMMSPEMWNGKGYTVKTDIWSLGCLVYQMAALKPPFIAENYAALYLKISRLKYEKILNYPKSFVNFIEKLIKKNPKLRPSCAEILKFEEFKKIRGETNDEENTSQRKKQKRSSLYCKPDNLAKNISKETFSVRRRKHIFSPYRLKQENVIKQGNRVFHSPIICNPREFSPSLSPTPQGSSPYRCVPTKQRLFKDYSMQLLKPLAQKDSSKKPLNLLEITPKSSIKLSRKISNNFDSLSHIVNLSIVSTDANVIKLTKPKIFNPSKKPELIFFSK